MSLEESKKIVREKGIRHIAFIMDGNGRWAKSRGKMRSFGHKAGAETFRRVLDYLYRLDVPCVTVYAFSTENWKRSPEEIGALMRIFFAQMRTAKKDLDEHESRLVFLGDKSAFKPSMVKKMNELEEYSKDHPRIVNIAMNYGSRAEILRAVNELLEKGGKSVTEEEFSSLLYTALSPDPDMIVRTAGEERLSNFLLWQAAYSELIFTDTLWPDMDEKEIDRILVEYAHRVRRFGGVVEDDGKEKST